MSYITRNLRQTITHWARSGTFNSEGQPTWSAPVEQLGRWENGVEKITSGNGEEIIIRSTVYLTSDVTTGDYLLLGEAASGALNPFAVSEAYEVKDFMKTPNLRATEFERVAKL